MKNYNNVDEYIASFPIEKQKLLTELRNIILEIAPTSTEYIAYNMPAYKLNEKCFVYFAGNKNHIGFYPTASGVNAFKDKLIKFKQSKGTIQIPYNMPLPINLLKEIIKFKVNEVSLATKN